MILEAKSFFALRLHGHQHIFSAALAGTFGAVTDWRRMLSELNGSWPKWFSTQLLHIQFFDSRYVPLWSQLISAVAKASAKKAKDSPVT